MIERQIHCDECEYKSSTQQKWFVVRTNPKQILCSITTAEAIFHYHHLETKHFCSQGCATRFVSRLIKKLWEEYNPAKSSESEAENRPVEVLPWS